MKNIGLLSDTHGYLDPSIKEFLRNCNEIWHAGDLGAYSVLQELEELATIRAVYGNIDGTDIRSEIPEKIRFSIEGLSVYMIHIGGYPGNYDKKIRDDILNDPPDLFISGHSHILKVIPDKKLSLLHINPGAAGKSGFHNIRTAVRFRIERGRIKNLEIWEKPRS